MFGWFGPKCPLDVPESLWIDQQMSWLAQTFGVERLKNAVVVLPTPEFFPDLYSGTEQDARAIFLRVCGYMAVDPGRVDLEFFHNESPRSDWRALGYYQGGAREKILIARVQLRDPLSLVATIAHELAHVHLLGDKRLSADDPMHELLADLLTVYLGLGVVVANSVMRESHERVGRFSRWQLSKQGYLPERMYGYALALFAWIRQEPAAPAWARRLRPNVRSVFQASLTYLAKTGDTQFRPTGETGARTEQQRIATLGSPSKGARLAALRDLKTLGQGADFAAAVLPRLKDEDPFIRVEAAELLGTIGPKAENAIPDLLDAVMQDQSPPLREAATVALGTIGQRADLVVPVLTSLLRRAESTQRERAARALGRFGAASVDAAQPLTDLLGDADSDVVVAAALALGAISGRADVAVATLIQALEGGDRPAAAAWALGAIGAPARAAVPALRKASKLPDPEVCEAAGEALRAITGDRGADLDHQAHKGKRKNEKRGRFTTG